MRLQLIKLTGELTVFIKLLHSQHVKLLASEMGVMISPDRAALLLAQSSLPGLMGQCLEGCYSHYQMCLVFGLTVSWKKGIACAWFVPPRFLLLEALSMNLVQFA